MNPLVSVIIPTFNHAHFLKKALESVIEQTYVNWEIIIIDNHSSDNTEDVINEFKLHNIILKKINNKGVIAASRNLGIKIANGEWLAFLDSDDIWYKEKLMLSINAINENKKINVICTDELMVNKITEDKQVLHHGPYCDDFYKTLLINGNRLSTSATLVKKSFLIKTGILFRENKDFVTAEDYDFWMCLAHANAYFTFLPSVQGEYLIHANNHSGQLKRHFNSVESVLKNHTYSIQKFTKNKKALWSFVRAGLLLNSGINFFFSGNYILGLRIIINTLIKHPLGSIKYFWHHFIKSIY